MYKQESDKRLLTLLRDYIFYGKEQSIFFNVYVVIFMLVTTDSLDLPILEWCCHFPVEFSVF